MAFYKKFIISLAGTALIGLSVFFDVTLPVGPEGVYEFLIALLTSFGVEKVKNG